MMGLFSFNLARRKAKEEEVRLELLEKEQEVIEDEEEIEDDEEDDIILENFTTKQLRELAKDAEITGFRKMSKDELIEALEEEE